MCERSLTFSHVVAHLGLGGVYREADGKVLPAIGDFKQAGRFIEIETDGFEDPHIQVMARRDPQAHGKIAPLTRLKGSLIDTRFHFEHNRKRKSRASFTILWVTENGTTCDFYGPESVQ